MNKAFFLAAAIPAMATAALAEDVTVDINTITASGVGDKIGTIAVSESGGGLSMKVSVEGISAGEHGFHVHEKGDCGPADKDGKPSAGEAAGPHFDPGKTKSHKGPEGGGHAGDLPRLNATAKGVNETVKVSGVKLADIQGRALMIHESGDNYTDDPANGGGKGRIACGVVPKG